MCTGAKPADGSDAIPGDLYCCDDCSEELGQPLPIPIDDPDEDDDDEGPLDYQLFKFHIYLLLRGQQIVYVGKALNPEARLADHSKKGWMFDDIIETSEGPYSEVAALRREEALIQCYQPVYNVQHRNGRRTPIKPASPYYLMFQALEAARLETCQPGYINAR